MTTEVISIGPRTDVEDFRMRSVAGGYPGDRVHHHQREINGRRFTFTHIKWGDGDVTFIVRTDDSTDFAHRWDHVLKRCESRGCHAPTRPHEDFCSEACWEEWHSVHEPEVLARATSHS